jgi:hypothetical protein
MQHDDFKGAVTTTFNERHWDVPRLERLARRCNVARELFEAEPDEVKKRIREEAMLEHEGEVRRWHDAVEGLPSMEVEDQEEYVVGVYQAVPFLTCSAGLEQNSPEWLRRCCKR